MLSLMYTQVMWALSDFTPENGATHIVKASHKGPPGALFLAQFLAI